MNLHVYVYLYITNLLIYAFFFIRSQMFAYRSLYVIKGGGYIQLVVGESIAISEFVIQDHFQPLLK